MREVCWVQTMSNIKLFGQKGCGGCEDAKRYMAENNHEYEYCDLQDSDAIVRQGYKKMLHAMGIKHIPALVDEDGSYIIGFDKAKYDELFGRK